MSKKIYADFTGGLNSNTTNAIGVKDLQIAQNVQYNAAGQLQTRRGYTTFGSEIGSSPITSYFFYVRDDTQAKVAICMAGSQIYYLDASAVRQPISGAGNNMEFETLPGRTTERTKRDFAVFKNKAYMCDGVNPYCSFDGTTFAQIGVSGAVVCTFDNTTDLITKVAHGLAVNDELYFTAGTTMPAGVTAYQVYYVATVPTADTFSISTTPNGTALNFTTNGTGTINYYKLTEPRTRFLTISQGVAWSMGEDKNPISAYYSNALTGLSDLTNINQNVAIIGPSEDGVINGINEYSQGVVVFKSSKSYYASLATGAFVSNQIDAQNGGYADRATKSVGNSLVYFNERGIDSLVKRTGVDGAGALESQPLSSKIRELINTIPRLSYNSCIGQFVKEDNNYLFAFDTDGDNIPDSRAVYSSLTGGRTTRTLPEAYHTGNYIDSDGNKQYLLASASGGQMYQHSYGFDDNGTAIQAIVKTGNFEYQEGWFEYIEVEGYKEEGDPVTITIFVDDIEDGTGDVEDSDLNYSNSISLGTQTIGTDTFGGGDATGAIDLYKYKVKIPFYTRGSNIAIQLESEGVQRIMEKITIKQENETEDTFAFTSIK